MNKNEIGTEWSTNTRGTHRMISSGVCTMAALLSSLLAMLGLDTGWSYCERGNEYNNTCSPKLKKFNKSIEKKP